MAGRDDFGILRSSLFTDDRARAAAELYAARGLAVEDTALATVAGHIGMLGLWAMRETDDGVLPKDGLAVVEDVTRTSRGRARVILQTLTDAGLLRQSGSGIYLVGFKDCYESIIERRDGNAEAKRISRRKAKLERKMARLEIEKLEESLGRQHDVTGTSGQTSEPQVGRPSDVSMASGLTVPLRAVPLRTVRSEADPPLPPEGAPGGGVVSPAAPDGTRNGHGPAAPSAAEVAGREALAAAGIRIPDRPAPRAGPGVNPEDEAVAAAILRELERSDDPEVRAAARATFELLRSGDSNPESMRAFIEKHTADHVDVIQKVRRTFAMQRNSDKHAAEKAARRTS